MTDLIANTTVVTRDAGRRVHCNVGLAVMGYSTWEDVDGHEIQILNRGRAIARSRSVSYAVSHSSSEFVEYEEYHRVG